jgi:hypothetical protein
VIKTKDKREKKMITFGRVMATDLEEIAAAEGRTFSDLVRECCRQYVKEFRETQRRSDKLQVNER